MVKGEKILIKAECVNDPGFGYIQVSIGARTLGVDPKRILTAKSLIDKIEVVKAKMDALEQYSEDLDSNL